eukprot:7238820-Prymnesium_polylepis.2
MNAPPASRRKASLVNSASSSIVTSVWRMSTPPPMSAKRAFVPRAKMATDICVLRRSSASPLGSRGPRGRWPMLWPMADVVADGR